MMTFLGVMGVAVVYSAVYFLMLLACPRCPHCKKGRLKPNGEDESGREVWTCPKCGKKVLL